MAWHSITTAMVTITATLIITAMIQDWRSAVNPDPPFGRAYATAKKLSPEWTVHKPVHIIDVAET